MFDAREVRRPVDLDLADEVRPMGERTPTFVADVFVSRLTGQVTAQATPLQIDLVVSAETGSLSTSTLMTCCRTGPA